MREQGIGLLRYCTSHCIRFCRIESGAQALFSIDYFGATLSARFPSLLSSGCTVVVQLSHLLCVSTRFYICPSLSDDLNSKSRYFLHACNRQETRADGTSNSCHAASGEAFQSVVRYPLSSSKHVLLVYMVLIKIAKQKNRI